MNYVLKYSRDHADSECVSRGVDHKGAEFIGNKQTNKCTNTQLFMLVQIGVCRNCIVEIRCYLCISALADACFSLC